MSKIGFFYMEQEKSLSEIYSKLSRISSVDTLLKESIKRSSKSCKILLFCLSNWSDGIIEDDWQEYLKNLNEEQLLHKSVVIYGMGEREEYCNSLLEAMELIYKKITIHGSTIIGKWPQRELSLFKRELRETQESLYLQIEVNELIEYITPYFSK